jgi:hypothetical protein
MDGRLCYYDPKCKNDSGAAPFVISGSEKKNEIEGGVANCTLQQWGDQVAAKSKRRGSAIGGDDALTVIINSPIDTTGELTMQFKNFTDLNDFKSKFEEHVKFYTSKAKTTRKP